MLMRESLGVSDRLDLACLSFIAAFSYNIKGQGATERSASRNGLELSLGMTAIYLSYRDIQEQQQVYDATQGGLLEIAGNPSAHIQTFDPKGNFASYMYDRNTGLVVANRYPFPRTEITTLSDRRKSLLDNSIAGPGMYLGYFDKVLTPKGLLRLTNDIETVVDQALY